MGADEEESPVREADLVVAREGRKQLLAKAKARGTHLARSERCAMCAHYTPNGRHGISQGDCAHHGHRLAMERACRRDYLDKPSDEV